MTVMDSIKTNSEIIKGASFKVCTSDLNWHRRIKFKEHKRKYSRLPEACSVHIWLGYHPMAHNTHWTVGNELNFVKPNEPTGEFERRPLEPRAHIIFSDKAVLLCKQHKDSRRATTKVNLSGAKQATTSEHKHHHIHTPNPLLHPHHYFSLVWECTSKEKTPGYFNLACFGVHCKMSQSVQTGFLLQKTKLEGKP